MKLLDGGGIVKTGLLEAAGTAGSGVAASSEARKGGDDAEFGKERGVASVEGPATMESTGKLLLGSVAMREEVAIAQRGSWEGWELAGYGIGGGTRAASTLQTGSISVTEVPRPFATVPVEGVEIEVFSNAKCNPAPEPKFSRPAARSFSLRLRNARFDGKGGGASPAMLAEAKS